MTPLIIHYSSCRRACPVAPHADDIASRTTRAAPEEEIYKSTAGGRYEMRYIGKRVLLQQSLQRQGEGERPSLTA